MSSRSESDGEVGTLNDQLENEDPRNWLAIGDDSFQPIIHPIYIENTVSELRNWMPNVDKESPLKIKLSEDTGRQDLAKIELDLVDDWDKDLRELIEKIRLEIVKTPLPGWATLRYSLAEQQLVLDRWLLKEWRVVRGFDQRGQKIMQDIATWEDSGRLQSGITVFSWPVYDRLR